MQRILVPARGVGALSQTPAANPFKSDVDVLNYALTLEHLEATFYREAVQKFTASDFTAIGLQGGVRDYIATIATDESDHVDTLTTVIKQLNGTPVAEGKYNFPYTDLAGFLKLALTVEDLGVAAYNGAARFIESADLLTAALAIHGVEARHAAYLALLNGQSPFPKAVNENLAPADVLKAAKPLIAA